MRTDRIKAKEADVRVSSHSYEENPSMEGRGPFGMSVTSISQMIHLQRTLGNRQVASMIQRTVRIGTETEHEEFTDPDIVRDRAFEANGANALSTENLAAMAQDDKPHLFASWDEAVASAETTEDPLELMNDIDSTVQSPVAALLRLMKSTHRGLLAEAREILETVELSSESKRTFKALFTALEGLLEKAKKGEPVTSDQFRETAMPLQALILRLQKQMFKLSESREPEMDNSSAPSSKGKYGYHLTKLHNLPGIRSGGLDPMAGASDRGSCAMSTKDQQEGSKKTSARMVAFAKQPSTFKPYINQYEDRRQMIEGAPPALKPVMLRFMIRTAIGLDNVIEGADYMDGSALNTMSRIDPSEIEVLSPDGWISIGDYDLNTTPIEMRSGDDNARQGMAWSGKPIVMTYEQLIRAATGGFFPNLHKMFSTDKKKLIQDLVAQRDKVAFIAGGVEFTFRGATMQTSGNPLSWEYAFTVKGSGALPGWLNEMLVAYQKNYASLATKQLEEFEKAKTE